MNVVNLNRATTGDALEVLADLKAKVESGEIIAFVAVGIAPDDTTLYWSSTTRPVTRLRMQGAISYLGHHFMSGDIA